MEKQRIKILSVLATIFSIFSVVNTAHASSTSPNDNINAFPNDEELDYLTIATMESFENPDYSIIFPTVIGYYVRTSTAENPVYRPPTPGPELLPPVNNSVNLGFDDSLLLN